eukprot:673375-Amphidinium_carterae.1
MPELLEQKPQESKASNKKRKPKGHQWQRSRGKVRKRNLATMRQQNKTRNNLGALVGCSCKLSWDMGSRASIPSHAQFCTRAALRVLRSPRPMLTVLSHQIVKVRDPKVASKTAQAISAQSVTHGCSKGSTRFQYWTSINTTYYGTCLRLITCVYALEESPATSSASARRLGTE